MEIWKDIRGYEGMYQASNKGSVKSLARDVKFTHSTGSIYYTPIQEKIRKPQIGTGYLLVALYKDTKMRTEKIHRLVAELFIPNPENKPCVNHIDGNTLNANVDNLEWVTYSENSIHAYKTGLIRKTYRNIHNAKLDACDVRNIRTALYVGKKQTDIAKQFNVCGSVISAIKHGRNYKGVGLINPSHGQRSLF